MKGNTLVLKRPIITEKSMAGTNVGRYTFEVEKAANKTEIAQAVVIIRRGCSTDEEVTGDGGEVHSLKVLSHDSIS